jgi:hypothetical protein
MPSTPVHHTPITFTPATSTPMPTTARFTTPMATAPRLNTPIGTTPMLTTPIGTMPIEMIPSGAIPTARSLGVSSRVAVNRRRPNATMVGAASAQHRRGIHARRSGPALQPSACSSLQARVANRHSAM